MILMGRPIDPDLDPVRGGPEGRRRGGPLSSKLSVGIHILTVLALYTGRPLTSEEIAESVNTNPVVIRRLLGLLREAGFVESKTGVGGGWLLLADPERINFLDILRAVEPHDGMFAMHKSGPNPLCPVGRDICGVLSGIYAEFEAGMARQLSCATLACVLGKLKESGALPA